MTLFRGLNLPYQGVWLRSDLLAGLTVWAVLVPESLAYATIAGVSPVIGLYAAPAALLLYAVFGSSRHLVTGPMAATAALSAAIVADVTTGDPADFLKKTVVLALVVGVIALVAGLIRLGFLASFISEPVLKGFIVGLALTIIVGQLPKLIGTEKVEGNFFEQLVGFIRGIGGFNLPTLVVGLASLAIVVGLKEVAPVVPGSLVAVLLGIAATAIFGLDDQGVDIVGPIAAGLPTFGLPSTDLHDYLLLAGAAVGVALVGFAEGLGAAKTYAARDHYEIDPNRELIGLGAANLGAGLSGGMVVNGSLSKTAVNAGGGAKSQVSALVVAILTLITLLFLTGLFEQLPEATLAAVVIAALIELVDWRTLRSYYRVYSSRLAQIYGRAVRADFIAAIAAMLGVLIFDTLPGLFIGIIVSILLLVYRTSRPHIATLGRIAGTTDRFGDIERNPEDKLVPGIAILRPESPLFFANAERVVDAIRGAAAGADVHTVVLDLGTVPDVDLSAAKLLHETAIEVASSGRTLLLAADIGDVREELEISGALAQLAVYPTIEDAVEAAQANVAGGRHAGEAKVTGGKLPAGGAK